MGPWRWRVKKFRPLTSSYISSFSGSAKSSIILNKHAADFASAMRFGLPALVFPTFFNASHLPSHMRASVFSKILFSMKKCAYTTL